MPKPDYEVAFEWLTTEYPNPSTELIFDGPFQLLIAVILSAQCTDARVNLTTPHLFKCYPDARSLAKAKPKDVEKIIHSCGFYRAKTKNIIKTSQDLVEKHGGKVPNTMEALTALAGVGRKTASVVLSQAFGLPAIAVDTHVKRVSQRLGWAKTSTPEKIERELRAYLPETLWKDVNGLLILHGRRVCGARKPKCEQCGLKSICLYFRAIRPKGSKKKA